MSEIQTASGRGLRFASAVLLAIGLLIVAALGVDDLLVHSTGWVGSLLNVHLSTAAAYCAAFVASGCAISRPRERIVWASVAAGLLSWAIGNTYFNYVFSTMEEIPFPSKADYGFVGFYPFVGIGMMLMVRARYGRANFGFDAAISAVGTSAIASAVVLPTVIANLGGDMAVNATNLAYSGGDVLLLGMAASIFGIAKWRVDRSTLAMTLGLGAFSATDIWMTYAVNAGTYQVGTILDEGWLFGGLLVASASFFQARPARPRARGAFEDLLVPGVFGMSSLGLLVWGSVDAGRPGLPAMLLASVTITLMLARMASLLRVNSRLLDEREQQAETDALTGLGNRRRLVADLHHALDGSEAPGAHVLVLYDLDGFKRYNDTFGHPAGDALLERLAKKLDAVVVPAGGAAYRLGGDEFCAWLPGTHDQAAALIERTSVALSEDAGEFSVTTSYGVSSYPEDGTDAHAIMASADERMYAFKYSVRHAPGEGRDDHRTRGMTTADPRKDAAASMRALSVTHPELLEMAATIASRLKLDAAEVERVTQLAELHDVGRVAIPDAILDKREPLSEPEWQIVRQHPEVGQRILGATNELAEVGRLVRATHERWDGTGYPDRLEGEQIPLPARIVFACDAFYAMVSDRPYRPAMTVQQAIEELRSNAGTQFDPTVVDALVTELFDRLQNVVDSTRVPRAA